tara:strand:- start:215 stop:799 length:585 start_codon:yes stop_codon:yes gene_type:complete
MEFIIHRVNLIDDLKKTPKEYGCEIDIRAEGSKLVLSHDPFIKGDNLLDYLDEYSNGTLVLNIKESGIEDLVLEEVRKRNIKSYFLLDVEFPYLYSASEKGEKNIALRFSEKEPIENVSLFQDKVDWVWIDTITRMPINKNNVDILKNFRVCLVCPSRWGRNEEISKCKSELIKLDFQEVIVMTKIEHINAWNI